MSKSISVIMSVYDQASELRENLPAFLAQEYQPGYEVIVVDETSTDDTPDILKLLKNEHPHLHTTFLPKPNRLVVRRKLAISIGLKAAKYEWVIITSIHNKPLDTDILQAIADNCDDNAELILGYLKGKNIRLQPFTTCGDANRHLRKAERDIRRIYNRKYMNYAWGRYDCIIVRKDRAFDILQYFEQKISCSSLLSLRLHIFFKNFFSRSATTVLTSA